MATGRSLSSLNVVAAPAAVPPLQSTQRKRLHASLSDPFSNCRLSYSLSPQRRTLVFRATICVGEKLPDATLSYIDAQGNLQIVDMAALTKGKRAVIFAVPGAFTPTCTQRHLPGFVLRVDEFKRRGVDTIACISVNDAFVMKAWGESLGVVGKILLLSDGNAMFTCAMGTILDLRDNLLGLGIRSCRYSLLAEDGVVTVLNLDDGGALTVSGAEDMLNQL